MFLMEDNIKYLLICLGAAIVIILILVIVLIVQKKANGGFGNKNEPKIIIEDNVRYNAKSDKVSDIKYNIGDNLLPQGKVITVSKAGPILPGKYYMVPGQENLQKFNMRIGGFVREYTNGDEIVLAEGEEICATSCNVVLK